MKNKWIKVEDTLPVMHMISPTWSMSDLVLVVIEGKYPTTARFNFHDIDKEPQWMVDGRGTVTHWQYIEVPNA
jgi:hypothetical protein